jgi:amidase
MFLSIVEDPNTKLPKLGFISEKAARRLRIGLAYEGMNGQAPHHEIRNAIAETARLCRELGHTVSEVTLPLDQKQVLDAFVKLWAVSAANAVDALARAKGVAKLEDGFEAWALGLRDEALKRGPRDEQVASVLPVFEAATSSLDRFFQEWDVLLTPVLAAPVFKTGARDTTKVPFEKLKQEIFEYIPYTPLHNICGTAAMSVPLSWDSNGLPVGSQFAARMGSEEKLFALAYELEEARPWRDKRPPHQIK